MKRDDLISRAAAIAAIEEYIEEYSELEPETGYHNLKWCAMEEAKDVLSMLPAVDAVPVVRCKDCKHYDRRCFICENDALLLKIGDCGCYPPFHVDDNWFCTDGERRDSE